MNSIPFCKFHGFGNDYIVIENGRLNAETDLSKLSRRMCDRHTGVGGDGIALLEKSTVGDSDYSCRIINPDGSEAGFSGNGTRCAVAYLYYKNIWSDKYLCLETKSGIKNYELLSREENTFWYLAELGKPKQISNFEFRIPDYDGPLSIITLDVGNPVCVLFVENFEFDWRKTGAKLEVDEHFPDRTNVVFVKVLDRSNVEIRIWERGAAETPSSGTCSIAAAVAAAYLGETGRSLSVRAVGGKTEAVWREDDEMLITGSAELAFSGEWPKS
ncbi:MAG: diaminopimelate epimerase [Pyrinomonadaceae bacterium]|nr:diaminopimelate epimerase [Pyrinomonadaceae bacterium]